MMGLFAKRKTTKEIVREQKRMVDKAIRGLERERQGMERQEKKLIMEMKTMAKKGQDSSVRIMAKDLVRIRKHQEKFLNMCAQLRAISLQMTEVSSTAMLAESMSKVTKSMGVLSQQIKLPALQKIMIEFAKQSEQMEMKQEMLTDAVDDAMQNEEDEEEQDAIVGQVLDEIGINLGQQLVSAHRAAPQEEVQQDNELENRLNNLKK
ncbi:Charged multivesicular body protein 2a [Plasmodiophora brassicae]